MSKVEVSADIKLTKSTIDPWLKEFEKLLIPQRTYPLSLTISNVGLVSHVGDDDGCIDGTSVINFSSAVVNTPNAKETDNNIAN